MWRQWIVWTYYNESWVPNIFKPSIWTGNVSEEVSMLFSLDYLQMREYFNHIVKNFIEFWELENHFIVSFYRYLNMCSISYMRHFLKDLDNLHIDDTLFQDFVIQVKNYIYSKINSKSHA